MVLAFKRLQDRSPNLKRRRRFGDAYTTSLTSLAKSITDARGLLCNIFR